MGGCAGLGYIEAHGKPVAIYSDKHSVFRNNTASAKGDGMTHFGRALEALNIEIIQEMLPPKKRNNNEPCRRSQGAHMFPSPTKADEQPVKRKRGRPPLPRLSPIEAAQRMLEPV